MPYVHKHFKRKLLLERAIPVHSHSQVLVGEAVAVSVSCWCRLSQLHGARWGNWPRSNQPSETFQVSLKLHQFPKTIGFEPEKKKKEEKLGNRELWWEESGTASCGSAPASSVCYSSCDTSWSPAASSSISPYPFLVHSFPSLAVTIYSCSYCKSPGLGGGEGIALLLEHRQPGAWQHPPFPAKKAGRWFWQMWSTVKRETFTTVNAL